MGQRWVHYTERDNGTRVLYAPNQWLYAYFIAKIACSPFSNRDFDLRISSFLSVKGSARIIPLPRPCCLNDFLFDMRTVMLCLKTSSFKMLPLYTVYEPDTDVDLPGRPSVCLVHIPCHSFSWHSGRIGLDTGPILLWWCFLLFATLQRFLTTRGFSSSQSLFSFVCFDFFMLSTNSYASESDTSLNLLLFRFSITLSSSKSRFDSASSVFFFFFRRPFLILHGAQAEHSISIATDWSGANIERQCQKPILYGFLAQSRDYAIKVAKNGPVLKDPNVIFLCSLL